MRKTYPPNSTFLNELTPNAWANLSHLESFLGNKSAMVHLAQNFPFFTCFLVFLDLQVLNTYFKILPILKRFVVPSIAFNSMFNKKNNVTIYFHCGGHVKNFDNTTL